MMSAALSNVDTASTALSTALPPVLTAVVVDTEMQPKHQSHMEEQLIQELISALIIWLQNEQAIPASMTFPGASLATLHMLRDELSWMNRFPCPVIENWVYRLESYPDDEMSRFTGFHVVPNPEVCGAIHAVSHSSGRPDARSSRSSCDVLSSDTEEDWKPVPIDPRTLQLDDVFDLQNQPTWWHDWYKFYYSTKARDRKPVSTICQDKLLHLLQNRKWISEIRWLKKQRPKKVDPSGGWVLTVPVRKTTQVIVVGDLHGGFHTFFRLLARWHSYNIINLKTLEVQDGYLVVFLGDILDRGQYALEIMALVMMMLQQNATTGRVVFNLGNHEEMRMNKVDGFHTEVKNKCKGRSDDVFQQLHRILALFPCAVILDFAPDYRVWCSHGLFYDGLVPENGVLTSSQAWQCKWNDIHPYPTPRKVQSDRGRDCFEMSIVQIQQFMHQNNIHFVIRGHQDKYHNTWMLHKNKMRSTDQINDHHRISLFEEPSQKVMRHPGPVSRILGHRDRYDSTLAPVLTLSTCTDLGRDLDADSFAIIHYSMTFEQWRTFEQMPIVSKTIQ